MKLKNLLVALAIATVPVVLFWGCNNKAGQPTSPSTGSGLTIKLASNPSAQFVGAALNLIVYNISGSSTSITGFYGPLSASAINGPISISVNVPNISNYDLISVEIVNNATLQALAVGASALSGSSGGAVTLGPLNKSFYQVSNLTAGDAFGFEYDTTSFVGVNTASTVPGLDVVCNTVGLGYALENPSFANNTVAYMGNGDFVNYLTVPPNSRFSNSSSASKVIVLGGTAQPVAIGDVYCVKILTGGYAWLQITNAGVIGVSGPSFVFRLNTTQNYCGYEQSKVDGAGPTPTPYAPLAFSASGVITGNDYGIAAFGAINSAAGSIFVCDASTGPTGNASVRVLSPALTSITNISGPGWPQGVAVAAGGTTIYVSSPYYGTPSVQMYSTSNLSSLGSVGAGVAAPPVALTPGPDTLAAALAGDMAVPEYLAVSPTSGNLFVTDSGTNGFADVLVMQAPTSFFGSAVTFWNGQIGTSTSPTGIATDGTTVYLADSGHNQIETYGINGTSGSTWTTDNNPHGAVGFVGPQGIALDSTAGLLFIADTGNNRVVEMTTSGVFKAAWGTWGLGTGVTPSTFNLPAAIAVDGATPPNVYVADSGNKRVLKFLGL